ncbi:MAG: hypothetical protein CV080_12385, partial [Candidatus Kuenenia stuttgartiensis]
MNRKYLFLPMAAMFSFGSFSIHNQSVSANSETSIVLVSKESKEDKDVVAIVNGQKITSNELYELLLST